MSDTLDLDALERAARTLSLRVDPLRGDDEEVRDYLSALLQAAGPSTVAALVARLRAAEAERDSARAEVERLRESVGQVLSEVGCDCCDCDCGAVADVHDPGCSPVTCLACRVEDALAAPEDVAHG